MLSEKTITNIAIQLSILFILWNVPFIALVLVSGVILGSIISVLSFIRDVFNFITKRNNNE